MSISYSNLQIPQLIKNFRSRNADGLSLTFLAIWLLGDLSSLCGGIITGIAPSAIVLSAYLCCSDSILLAQTLYYRSVRRAELRNKDQENPADYTDERSALLGNDSSTTPASQGRQPEGANTNSSQQASPSGSIVLYDLVALVGVWVVGILGYFVTHAPKFGVSPFLTTTSWEPSPELKVFGEMLGYLGALCYLRCDCQDFSYLEIMITNTLIPFSARIPQIVKNHKETSTEGCFFFLPCRNIF